MTRKAEMICILNSLEGLGGHTFAMGGPCSALDGWTLQSLERYKLSRSFFYSTPTHFVPSRPYTHFCPSCPHAFELAFPPIVFGVAGLCVFSAESSVRAAFGCDGAG